MYLDLKKIDKKQIKRSTSVNANDQSDEFKFLLTVAIKALDHDLIAGGLLFSLNTFKTIRTWISPIERASYKYLPTYLSLRNKSILLKVIEHFEEEFDVLLIEGAGIQHPRRFGLASEVGVEVSMPTIGITRKNLWGQVNSSPNEILSSSEVKVFPIYDGNDMIGNYLLKKGRKRGICISIGHKITLVTATQLILPLLQYRLPEPLRVIKETLNRVSFVL